MNISEKKTINWYEKKWLVAILCITIFPIGIYAIWKNSTISKVWKFVITTIIVILFITGLNNEENIKTELLVNEAKSEITTKKVEKKNKKSNPNLNALNEIKKEPKVKEAIITEANVLYVSVEDDGTIRNGYAQYLCEILRQHKATTKWVKIVKFNSINESKRDNAFGILLGESNCN